MRILRGHIRPVLQVCTYIYTTYLSADFSEFLVQNIQLVISCASCVGTHTRPALAHTGKLTRTHASPHTHAHTT